MLDRLLSVPHAPPLSTYYGLLLSGADLEDWAGGIWTGMEVRIDLGWSLFLTRTSSYEGLGVPSLALSMGSFWDLVSSSLDFFYFSVLSVRLPLFSPRLVPTIQINSPSSSSLSRHYQGFFLSGPWVHPGLCRFPILFRGLSFCSSRGVKVGTCAVIRVVRGSLPECLLHTLDLSRAQNFPFDHLFFD